MIFHEFPDLQWLKRQAEEGFANRKDAQGRALPNQGWPNVILNARSSNTYRDNIKGPVSIFTNISGKSIVEVHGKRAVVNEGFFFVTNYAQHYTLQIDNTKTETFNIHFGENFADGVLHAVSKPVDKLIETDKLASPLDHLELYAKLHSSDAVVTRLISEIRGLEGNRIHEEEKLAELMLHLLKLNGRIKEGESQIPVIKNSTREEIQKRLNNATDFIYSFYDKNISLDDIAAAACLSKFHFLRLFKTVYRQTPHQFITAIKIDRAKAMLKSQATDVNQIARSLGFDNSSSFSRAFFNQVKAYPTQFRAQC
jgi:AraC family transcriptional regulator